MAATLAPIAVPATQWRNALVAGTAGKLGIVLLLVGGAVAILGPYVAPYSPTALVGLPLDSPSAEHLLGTDQLGRDVLSRVLNGGRSVLILATLAVIVTFIVGGPLGMLAGYRDGKLDGALSRMADVLMSIPPLILVLIFIFVVGSSNLTIVLLTGLVTAPRVFRIIRGATQAVAEQDFILAARARGEGTGAIIGRELLPNVTGPASDRSGDSPQFLDHLHRHAQFPRARRAAAIIGLGSDGQRGAGLPGTGAVDLGDAGAGDRRPDDRHQSRERPDRRLSRQERQQPCQTLNLSK